jgi:hypothetical protein
LDVVGDTKIAGNVVITNTTANDALRIEQTGTADPGSNAFVVYDIANDTTPFLIDRDGRVIVGTGRAYNSVGTNNPIFQLHGNSAARIRFSISSWELAGTLPPVIDLAKSGTAGAVGTHSIVADNALLGTINFHGSNGTAFLKSASIEAEIDGTPSATSMPGSLIFNTNSGTTTDAERMRITPAGNVGIATAAPTHKLHVNGDVRFTSNIIDTPIVSITSAATYADNAAGRVIVVNSTSAVTVTFAAAAYDGFTVTVVRKNTGNVTIANSSNIVKLNTANYLTSNILGRYLSASIVYTATNEFILLGDIL